MNKKTIATLFLGVALVGIGYHRLRHTFNAAGGMPNIPEIAPENLRKGDKFYGTATGLHDGDTFKVQGRSYRYSVRTWGGDAFEIGQRCKKFRQDVACDIMERDALASLIDGQIVICEVKGRSYQRVTALCLADIEGKQQDIVAVMIQRGMMLEDRQYSRGYYMSEENAAKASRKGLWSMEFETPKHWRACHGKSHGRPPPADCRLTQ